jgi:glycosyltransferase involved in cell wall biosynthesis
MVDYAVITVASPPLGISNAMNEGAKVATSEFLIHLHSDDLFYDENSLAIIHSSLAVARPNWIAAGCQYVNSQGMYCGSGPSGSYSRARLLRSNMISHPSTVLRRSTFNEMGGFDESLDYVMDYDLWLRMSLNERPIILSEITTKFRVHEGSASSSNVKEMRREELVVRLRYTKGCPARILARLRFMLTELLSSHSRIQKTYLRAKFLIKKSEN